MAQTATAPMKGAAPERQSRPIKILVYGVSGVGKTQFALSATAVKEMCPVLVLDVERGLIGVDPSDQWAGRPVNNVMELEQALSQANRYRTIVLDSITRMARITTTTYASARTPGQTNDEIQLGDYGKTLIRLGSILDALHRSPQNVIVIAGQKFVYAEGSTKSRPIYSEILPDIDGKLLDRAQETSDMTWCLNENQDKRFLITLPKSPYRIKSRRILAGIPPHGAIEAPTMAKVFEAFQSSFK